METDRRAATGPQAPPSTGAWPAAPDLPDPRLDGMCAVCEKKEAVTRDGRFCAKCLKDLVVRMNPGSVVPKGVGRTAEHKEARGDVASPWDENNVRILEGD